MLPSFPSFLPSFLKQRETPSILHFLFSSSSPVFFLLLLSAPRMPRETEGGRGKQREPKGGIRPLFLLSSSFFLLPWPPSFLPSLLPSFLASSMKGTQRGSNGRQREAEAASSFFISPFFFLLVVFCSFLPSYRPSVSCSPSSFSSPHFVSYSAFCSMDAKGDRRRQRGAEGARGRQALILHYISLLLPSFLRPFLASSSLSSAPPSFQRQREAEGGRSRHPSS